MTAGEFLTDHRSPDGPVHVGAPFTADKPDQPAASSRSTARQVTPQERVA